MHLQTVRIFEQKVRKIVKLKIREWVDFVSYFLTLLDCSYALTLCQPIVQISISEIEFYTTLLQ